MEILNELLEIIDKTPIDHDTPFQSEHDKNIYESNLMFIYRRAEAAKYHLSNVQKLIEAEKSKEISNLKLENIKLNRSLTNIKASVSILKINVDISNEFVAFLSAIRSGLDFMSKFMIRHIKGVKGDSLKTLIKLKNKKVNKILLLIKQNEEWLTFIRNYRDALIHNFNHVYHVKNIKTFESGNIDSVFYPVVVSKDVPKFELDTRRFRSLFNVDDKYIILEKKVEISTVGKKIVEKSIEVQPANGFIEISKFMEEQYNSYVDLFSKFLVILKEIKLKIIEFKKV